MKTFKEWIELQEVVWRSRSDGSKFNRDPLEQQPFDDSGTADLDQTKLHNKIYGLEAEKEDKINKKEDYRNWLDDTNNELWKIGYSTTVPNSVYSYCFYKRQMMPWDAVRYIKSNIWKSASGNSLSATKMPYDKLPR